MSCKSGELWSLSALLLVSLTAVRTQTIGARSLPNVASASPQQRVTVGGSGEIGV